MGMQRGEAQVYRFAGTQMQLIALMIPSYQIAGCERFQVTVVMDSRGQIGMQVFQ